MDPFALLGLPRRYDLDLRAIEGAHLRLLATLHPDRIADEVERPEAARRMAEVNAAREVLLDDERRADALVVLLGGPTREEERALPEGFLADVLELRERLDEAIASGDGSARREFERLVAEERSGHLEAVGLLLAQAGAAGTRAGAAGTIEPAALRATLKAARLRLNAWRYVERMREALRDGGRGGASAASPARGRE
ncbi:MAG TPA: DnaJ domain-containing protein [Phycisphaerales bacterium]|nr:DnaJ domain-containing protein [Phycisphaerales bacterium]HMP36222.1 DnaJ domain-containing protein [Phycisphaerales bacterium]